MIMLEIAIFSYIGLVTISLIGGYLFIYKTPSNDEFNMEFTLFDEDDPDNLNRLLLGEHIPNSKWNNIKKSIKLHKNSINETIINITDPQINYIKKKIRKKTYMNIPLNKNKYNKPLFNNIPNNIVPNNNLNNSCDMTSTINSDNFNNSDDLISTINTDLLMTDNCNSISSEESFNSVINNSMIHSRL
jgi:hypothetical protein